MLTATAFPLIMVNRRSRSSQARLHGKSRLIGIILPECAILRTVMLTSLAAAYSYMASRQEEWRRIDQSEYVGATKCAEYHQAWKDRSNFKLCAGRHSTGGGQGGAILNLKLRKVSATPSGFAYQATQPTY